MMYLKFITEHAPSPNAPDYHLLVADVMDYHVTDHWQDWSAQITSHQDLCFPDTNLTDKYCEEPFIILPGNNHPQPAYGSYQIMRFRINTTHGVRLVMTSMPVYVMNNKGSSIQKYVPHTYREEVNYQTAQPPSAGFASGATLGVSR